MGRSEFMEDKAEQVEIIEKTHYEMEWVKSFAD